MYSSCRSRAADILTACDACSPAAVMSKIGLDQLIMAPIGTLIFFASQQVMQGKPHTIRSQVKEKLWPTTVAGYKLWPLAHLVNFALIPPAQRVLYVNLVSVCLFILTAACVIANHPVPSHGFSHKVVLLQCLPRCSNLIGVFCACSSWSFLVLLTSIGHALSRTCPLERQKSLIYGKQP